MGRRRPATHHTFVQNKRIRVVLLDGTIVRGRFVRSLRDAIIATTPA